VDLTDAQWELIAPLLPKHRQRKDIGDRAFDSDPLDTRLRKERGIDRIASHRSTRKRANTQDGRMLRRYLRRWKIERLFAWLLNYRRLTTR
jgi:transposase